MTVKVLVVEDERAAREGVQMFLEQSGYDVRAAGDADCAVAEATDWSPDVLVCDWQLGGPEDGVDVARAIQVAYGTAIIFITSYPLEYLKRHVSGLAVRQFLRKPVLLSALLAAVESASPAI